MLKKVYDKNRHIAQDMYDFVQSEENAYILKASTVGVTYPSKDFISAPFISKFVCIEYVESGAGVVRCGKKIFHPLEGDAYILPKGQPTQFWTDIETPWKKYWFNVDGQLCDKICEAYKLSNATHYHKLDISPEIHELIEISKSEQDQTGKLIEITNNIFYKMYCHTIKEEPDNLGTQIMQFINTHITEPFSIDEMEQMFNKSRSQIFRAFKEQYGITPYTHYLNKKISLAKNLLTSTQLPISEIAVNLAFYDEYHFSKCFKQKEGITPYHYRKTNGF